MKKYTDSEGTNFIAFHSLFGQIKASVTLLFFSLTQNYLIREGGGPMTYMRMVSSCVFI